MTILAFYSEFRATLPPETGETAKIPHKAPGLPPSCVERSELVESVAKDLVAMDRAADTTHVLRGMPRGGKTVAANEVMR